METKERETKENSTKRWLGGGEGLRLRHVTGRRGAKRRTRRRPPPGASPAAPCLSLPAFAFPFFRLSFSLLSCLILFSFFFTFFAVSFSSSSPFSSPCTRPRPSLAHFTTFNHLEALDVKLLVRLRSSSFFLFFSAGFKLIRGFPLNHLRDYTSLAPDILKLC